MLKSIAVALLKMLLAYLGANVDAETRAMLDAYDEAARKLKADKQIILNDIERTETANSQLAADARVLSERRVQLEAENEQTKQEVEDLQNELKQKMDSIHLQPDADVLRSDLFADAESDRN